MFCKPGIFFVLVDFFGSLFILIIFYFRVHRRSFGGAYADAEFRAYASFARTHRYNDILNIFFETAGK